MEERRKHQAAKVQLHRWNNYCLSEVLCSPQHPHPWCSGYKALLDLPPFLRLGSEIESFFFLFFICFLVDGQHLSMLFLVCWAPSFFSSWPLHSVWAPPCQPNSENMASVLLFSTPSSRKLRLTGWLVWSFSSVAAPHTVSKGFQMLLGHIQTFPQGPQSIQEDCLVKNVESVWST